MPRGSSPFATALDHQCPHRLTVRWWPVIDACGWLLGTHAVGCMLSSPAVQTSRRCTTERGSSHSQRTTSSGRIKTTGQFADRGKAETIEIAFRGRAQSLAFLPVMWRSPFGPLWSAVPSLAAEVCCLMGFPISHVPLAGVRLAGLAKEALMG